MAVVDDALIGWRAQLAANLADVRARIAAAARRSGRASDAVRLVTVVKMVDAAVLPVFGMLGLHDLAENRVQQLVVRAGQFGAGRDTLGESDAPSNASVRNAAPPTWHMIGHLQRNKVKALLPHCRIIHAVDSLRLAQEIDACAAAMAVTVDCLLEVNVSGETSKFGLAPAELDSVAASAAAWSNLRLRGLMTIAPLADDPSAARPHFAQLRDLRDGLLRRGIVGAHAGELSMGMTHDYEIAIEEGATIVRIGSALCAGLPVAAAQK